MSDLKFENFTIPSERFAPGLWRVTRCFEAGEIVSIDLGWLDEGAGGKYRAVGDFTHESEAIHVIGLLESLSAPGDIGATLTEAGFAEYQASGFSYGEDRHVRPIREFVDALIEFDMDDTRLWLGLSDGVFRREDIGGLRFRTKGTRLEALGRPENVATTVLCSLLKARIDAGDATRPLVAA